jgi:hypothetical protein
MPPKLKSQKEITMVTRTVSTSLSSTNTLKPLIPSKSELWKVLPEKLREAIGDNSYKEAETLFPIYSDGLTTGELMHEFWCLKKDDFQKFAIGWISSPDGYYGDPFFAYHVRTEKGEKATVTLHEVKGLPYHEPKWIMNYHHWKDGRKETLLLHQSSQEFPPLVLDHIAKLFQNKSEYTLIGKDDPSHLTISGSGVQSVKNISVRGSISVSSVHTSGTAQREYTITCCARCGISQISGSNGVHVNKAHPGYLSFKDNRRTYTIEEDGVFKATRIGTGDLQIVRLRNHCE